MGAMLRRNCVIMQFAQKPLVSETTMARLVGSGVPVRQRAPQRRQLVTVAGMVMVRGCVKMGLTRQIGRMGPIYSGSSAARR